MYTHVKGCCAGPNHVEIDVDQAAMQVFVGLDRRGVIAVLPERPVSIFPLVIFLRRSSQSMP